MNDTLRFLVDHGYLVLFVFVFLEQVGVPLPAIPVLLGVGALAGMGQMVAIVAVAVATAASILADGIWYHIGRARGGRVLRLLCRISLEPDSCVRVTQNTFERYGARSLLIAKFVPGLNTIAPPMAGINAMPLRGSFCSTASAPCSTSGPSFSSAGSGATRSRRSPSASARSGAASRWFSAPRCSLWLLAKFARRWLFLRELRIARITPEELKARMESGEAVVVVDLRHSTDVGESGASIPGAIRVAIDDIESGHERIPRDREVVLFCT